MTEFTGNHPRYVVIRREDLFEFLGRVGLPPWTGSRGELLGGDVDCAPLAREMIDWVEQNEVDLGYLFRVGMIK